MYLTSHFFNFLSARNLSCYLLHRTKQMLQLPWLFSRSIFHPGIPLTSDRFLGVPLSRFSRPQVTHVNVARPHALMLTRPFTGRLFWAFRISPRVPLHGIRGRSVGFHLLIGFWRIFRCPVCPLVQTSSELLVYRPEY